MTLNKKVKAELLSLIWHMGNYFGCELWNYNRQFYGTVYVISWTVNTALSTIRRKIVHLEHMFVSFQDFVGKTRNFSVWSLARFSREERYTLYRKIGLWKDTIVNLFIGELLITSESRTLHFANSGIFVDGRNKEKRISKLKINWIVSRSVIYLSGRT